MHEITYQEQSIQVLTAQGVRAIPAQVGSSGLAHHLALSEASEGPQYSITHGHSGGTASYSILFETPEQCQRFIALVDPLANWHHSLQAMTAAQPDQAAFRQRLIAAALQERRQAWYAVRVDRLGYPVLFLDPESRQLRRMRGPFADPGTASQEFCAQMGTVDACYLERQAFETLTRQAASWRPIYTRLQQAHPLDEHEGAKAQDPGSHQDE